MTAQYIELEGTKINKEKLKQIIKDNPDLIEKKVEGRYFFPKEGDQYHLMYSYDGVSKAIKSGWCNDDTAISLGAYKTKEQAQQAFRRQQALVRIRKYVQENGLYFEPDRKDGSQDKHAIGYIHSDNALWIYQCGFYQVSSDLPFFKYLDDTKQAMKACEEDYLIYFGQK